MAKVSKNISKIVPVLLTFAKGVRKGSTKSNAISKSKIKNKIATRKNRKEKGRRADLIGSNPHSYGETFFKSGLKVGKVRPAANKRIVNLNAVIT